LYCKLNLFYTNVNQQKTIHAARVTNRLRDAVSRIFQREDVQWHKQSI